MHGLGNDFIILDDFDYESYDLSILARSLCHRQLGIGADGIVLILPSVNCDVRMRIINSDGSEAEMCGNAIRCLAKYVFEKGLIKKEAFLVETIAGNMGVELVVKSGLVKLVKVNMGLPRFNSIDIPKLEKSKRIINQPLKLKDQTLNITSLRMGVPHTVIFVENIEQYDIVGIGKEIEVHPEFPEGTNVNFVQVINRNELLLRTWERGVGLTLACGTGSCASVVASVLNEKTDKNVIVHLQLGDLMIDWSGENVIMSGKAEYVYSGMFERMF